MDDTDQCPADTPPLGSPEDSIACAEVWAEWLRGVAVPTSLLMAIVEGQYLDEWMQLATQPREGRKTTSAKAARELCAVAAVCLVRNHPMPDVVRLHIAKALKAVAEGKSADVALGVKRGVGQAKKDDPMNQLQRERIIAGFIRHLVSIHHLTVPDAKERACEQFGRSDAPGGGGNENPLDMRTVELYWAKHRGTLDNPPLSLDEHREIYRSLSEMR